jgi:hypothetical protein
MRSKNVGNAIALIRIFDEIQWQKMPRISVKVIVSDYLTIEICHGGDLTDKI